MEIKEIICECGEVAAFSLREDGVDTVWVCHHHFAERLRERD